MIAGNAFLSRPPPGAGEGEGKGLEIVPIRDREIPSV
jgi:hypothetical protein